VAGGGAVTFYGFAKAVVGAVLRVGWRLHVHGADRVPSHGALIVASNHVSYFDPPALGVAMPRPIHYMAKKELFEIAVLGAAIRRLHAFPVDRTRGDVAAIKQSVRALRSGAAVGIFPEGTRNRSGTLRPQTGVALLASLSGAPVLPAYIAGTAHANRFARIDVAFGEPFDLAGGRKARREDLEKWTDEVMARVFALRGTIGAD
jgi:1-acyl-sn-glycerol-3-phosphate acyltransferase